MELFSKELCTSYVLIKNGNDFCMHIERNGVMLLLTIL